jgi:hypothetical protein
MKANIKKYLIVSLVLFSLSQSYSQSSLTNGTQVGSFIKFTANDNHLEEGFRITALVKIKSTWWDTEQQIIEIRQYKSDNVIMSFHLYNGTFIIHRPVKYGNTTNFFKLDSWNKEMISQSQYTSNTIMKFDIAFSEGSYKIFIREDAADDSTGVCEMGFWGLGSGSNGLKNKLDSEFFGTTYDLVFWKNNSHGFQSGTFEKDHNRNYKSCFTLNERHNGIPSANMADPLSGVTSNNKKNCASSSGSQARKTSLNNYNTEETLKDLVASDLDEVKVYPIPANNYFTLNFPKHWQHKNIEVHLVDLSGRAFISNLRFVSYAEKEIDLSSISPGVYILTISNGELIEKKKIIIK